MTPCMYLIEGPVGAGKSTYGIRLGRELNTSFLALDDWMATLFREDRPETDVFEWYGARKLRCIDQILKVAQGVLATGSPVVVELGLVQRANRAAFYQRLDEAGIDFKTYVLDVPIDLRRKRVQQRNLDQGETFSMVVPDEIFEMASAMWQAPDAAECAARDIEFVETRAE